MPQSSFPQIQRLLPHRPPMLLLDRILATTDSHLWCQISTEACPDLIEADGIPSNLTMEYLAQAGALLLGLQGSTETAAPAEPGLLVGCARLSCRTPFLDPAHVIVVQVGFASAVPARANGLVRLRGELASFQATAALDLQADGWAEHWPSEPIASAELSVYLPAKGAPSIAKRALQ